MRLILQIALSILVIGVVGSLLYLVFGASFKHPPTGGVIVVSLLVIFAALRTIWSAKFVGPQKRIKINDNPQKQDDLAQP